MVTTDLNVPHSVAFFEQMRTCRARYRLLGEAFLSVLRSGWSVLDVGCGTGAQTARLAELGMSIVGVDAFDSHPDPGFPFFVRDILEKPYKAPFDTVICTETAEHIYESRADRLVEAVTDHALRRIIWSAAPPGQEWEGHVNLQPHGYWLEKLGARGFKVNEVSTGALRDLIVSIGAQHSGAVHNFYVLDREKP